MSALLPLALLVLLLPFEPLAPVARVLGFEVSFLELAALVLLSASAIASFLVPGARSNRDIPLFRLAFAFLVVCLLSTYWAPSPRLLPLKFCLRVAAGVVAFVITAWALEIKPRVSFLLGAFVTAGTVTALVALAEIFWGPALTGLLAPFREHAFEVGGHPRAAATFAYPNTAAGFVLLTLPGALYFFTNPAASRLGRGFATTAALAMFAAVLLTYSRGALLGAGVTVFSFWLGLRAAAPGARGAVTRLSAGFAVLTLAVSVYDPAFRWRTATEGDESWYRVSLRAEEPELSLAPAELARTNVLVRNTGKMTWASEGDKAFHLSYRWFAPEGGGKLTPLPIEGERTRLRTALGPGERARLAATVRAPRTPGRYVLIWDMVHEHTTWFSDKVGLGTPVQVRVGDVEAPLELPEPGALRSTIASRAWRPGRKELWTIALELFLERPLLGIGPDNFRWRYGPAAGREHWDTRTFSNSLYLELLSTTGLVGAGVFFALIAGALRGLMRRRTLVALALSSALLGFLVHGIFDYLLEPTAMYLAFWMLLGAASAVLREEATA